MEKEKEEPKGLGRRGMGMREEESQGGTAPPIEGGRQKGKPV